MKKTLLLLTVALTGCAYTHFTPFEGKNTVGQPSSGAFVNREYALPIYRGEPPRPYAIIGLIEASDRAMSIEGVEHASVRVAKAKGADAVIQTAKGSQYGGSTGGFAAFPTATGGGIYGSSWSQAKILENADFIAIKFVQ